MSTNVCVMYGKYEESMGHLFFNCPFAQRIWNLCNNWIGITRVHHILAKNHFHQFCILRLSKKGNSIWKCIWVAIVWTIWMHRNGIIFRSKVKDGDEVFNLAEAKAWMWITNKVSNARFTYSD